MELRPPYDMYQERRVRETNSFNLNALALAFSHTFEVFNDFGTIHPTEEQSERENKNRNIHVEYFEQCSCRSLAIADWLPRSLVHFHRAKHKQKSTQLYKHEAKLLDAAQNCMESRVCVPSATACSVQTNGDEKVQTEELSK